MAIQVVVRLMVSRTAATVITEIARRDSTTTVEIVVATGVAAPAMKLNDELAKACLRCLWKVNNQF